MKIIHAVAGIEEFNGAAVIACGIARAQAEAGHDVTVVTTSCGSHLCSVGKAKLVIFPRSRLPLFKQICFSMDMFRQLPEICRDADLVNTHCQWTFPVWYAAFCAKNRLSMTPEGSFDPVRLRHSAWKKRLVGWLDRLAVRKADTLHATVPMEADWIREFEPRTKRIITVPPGVDVSMDGPNLSPVRNRASGSLLRVLYLGRKHPLKGLDMLEEAVKGLPIEMKIISNAFGQEKEAWFRWCDVLCLPTRSENFGLVVAEALAHRRPVIVTSGAPWSGVAEHKCGWFTDISTDSIRKALKAAIACSGSELEECGRRGQEWMARDFRWSVLAPKLT